jgi:DNA helicase-2/ATP-dependent DNA helicase PcrA
MNARGIALEEIAILYRQKGALLNSIQAVLSAAKLPFVAERDSNYPRAPVVRWLQDCAGMSLGGTDFNDIRFEEIVRFYHSVTLSAGMTDSEPDLSLRRRVYEATLTTKPPDMRLGDWLEEMNQALSIRAALESATEYADDLETFDHLTANCKNGKPLSGHLIRDFARDGRVKGRIVVTTLHSSKGRQFDAVIVPGLVEGIMPRRPWNRKTRINDEPAPQVLSEDRRLFYVGFTRARKVVFLVYGDSYTNDYGYPVTLGVSRLVREIRDRLRTSC